MVVPSAPTQLAVDAIDEITSILTWSAPLDDGGFPILDYTVTRNLRNVDSIDVDGGGEGSGYDPENPPTVTIEVGEGNVATAVAEVDTMAPNGILSITVTYGGTLYTTIPTVTIDPPVSGSQAMATATLSIDVILSIASTQLAVDAIDEITSILTWSAPLDDGGFPILDYTVTRNLRNVDSIDVDGGGEGSGYDPENPPTVTIEVGEGNVATAVAEVDTMAPNGILSITVTYGGTLYTTIPTVTIDPPVSGSQAMATATLSIDVILSSTVPPTPTIFTDSTLSARQTPFYFVQARNSDGLGDPSGTSTATTATSQAQTIKELLFNNWSLTGELAKITTANMTEPVHFYDRGQVPGNKFPKAITVQKINDLGNENIIEHPTFFEQADTFEITCFLQVTDSADDTFSVWIDLMQQMTTEVTRILKTIYSPAADTGEFFRTTTNWSKDDTFFPDDPELTRTLRFTLTRILSNSDEVFIGYPGAVSPAGVLVFDSGQSSADNLPTSDYIYTQVYRVEVIQGWRNIPYITTDSPQTTAIPIYYRGAFSGRFNAMMDLKKSDINSSTFNSLSQIFLPQSNGELGTTVFLHQTGNTEVSPVVLRETIFVNITEIQKVSENEELVKFHIRGNLTQPSTFNAINTLENMQYTDIIPIELMAYVDGGIMAFS